MDITRHHTGPRMSQAVEHNNVVYLAGQVNILARSVHSICQTDQETHDVPT